MRVKKMSTRDQLLSAAALEFAKHGYAKTNINTVSQKAGFGKGTIYNYFENKHNLFLSVFSRTMNDVVEEIRAATEAIDNPIEKLKMAIFQDFNYFEKNEELIVLILRESFGAARESQVEFMKAAEPLFAIYMEIVVEGMEAKLFRQDINPLIVTLQFVGMSENLILSQHTLDQSLGTAEELAQTVIDTFLNGIKIEI